MIVSKNIFKHPDLEIFYNGSKFLVIVIPANLGCETKHSVAYFETLNVLMICVNDINDWVGCFNGYLGTQTPNIFKLAAKSINYECTMYIRSAFVKFDLSRTAIVIGLRPSNSGTYKNNQWWTPNLPAVKTIPDIFKQKGYYVLGGGKIYHHTAGNNPPEQWDEYPRMVFDDNWDWAKPGQNTTPWVEYEPIPEYIPINDITTYQYEYDRTSLEKPIVEYGALRWAQQQLQKDFDKPFFRAVGFFHPHLPWYASEEYYDKYPSDRILLPDNPHNDLVDIPVLVLKLAWQGSEDYRKVLVNNKYKEAVQAYLPNLSFADYMVGEVLETLEKRPYDENILIVFWLDYGWHLGEKNHWHKLTLWQRSTNVPLILSGQGVPQNIINDPPVILLDVYPTLVDYCYLESNPLRDGENLIPFIRNPDLKKQDPVLIIFKKGNNAWQGHLWKYIPYHDVGEEFYNFIHDLHG